MAGNYIANLFDMPLVHHGSGATFWAIVILFVVQIITILLFHGWSLIRVW